MAVERLFVRCPFCNYLHRWHNDMGDFGLDGPLEVVVHRITSAGRKRIQNEWIKQPDALSGRAGQSFIASVLFRAKKVVKRLERLLSASDSYAIHTLHEDGSYSFWADSIYGNQSDFVKADDLFLSQSDFVKADDLFLSRSDFKEGSQEWRKPSLTGWTLMPKDELSVSMIGESASRLESASLLQPIGEPATSKWK